MCPTSSGASGWPPPSCWRTARRPTEAELQQWVRDRLRSTRTPSQVSFVAELPYNETGKLLRRVLRDDLAQRS